MRFNKEKLKSFLLRRRINAFGLFVITVMSALITLICGIRGISAAKLDLLIWVTISLVMLCFIQAFKMSKSFKTLHAFKGHRKRKKLPSYED